MDSELGGFDMYQKEVYDALRKEDPECFQSAEGVLQTLLGRGRVFVRAVVKHTADRSHELSEIHVIGLEGNSNIHVPKADMLFRLQFRMEVKLPTHEVVFLGHCLDTSGPVWDGKRLERADIVNALAAHLSGWKFFPPWTANEKKQFVGNIILTNDTQMSVPAHHPLVFPLICVAFGTLVGGCKELESEMMIGGSFERQQAVKDGHFRSFKEKFSAFVRETQRENARTYFGTIC